MGTDNSPEKTVTAWICSSNPTAEMNAKYALALILALQVSMSLCELPPPSDELLLKYEEYERTFLHRLLTAYKKLETAVAPAVTHLGETDAAKAAMEYTEGLGASPKIKTLAKVYSQMSHESLKMAQNARMNALSLYETYLREHVGEYLSDAIDKAKVYLNMFLPVEQAADHSI